MYSLSSRLLLSVSVLLLVFFGVTIAVLDSAFTRAGEQSQQDILDGQLVGLLAAAEEGDTAGLVLPPHRLREPRFEQIGSGLYGQLRRGDGSLVWQSDSALGLELPQGTEPALGNHLFARETLADGTPLLTLSLAVEWEFDDESTEIYVFKVAESLDSFNAQVARFRGQLFGWFGLIALTMLLAFSLLLRGLMKPLRQIESEIGEIEEGRRSALSEAFPAELAGVARNLNLLIGSERARSDRYRYTLDNLAHSLKTPLAAMRALLQDGVGNEAGERCNEQIDRMDEIVRYQLRKPAASAADKLVLAPVAVSAEVSRLIEGLQKVYRDKAPQIEARVEPGIRFRGDTGDFLELAGNLLDNACKWCQRAVRITIAPAESRRSGASGMLLTVADEGPGIPEAAAETLLQRGMRLDENTPGHGIGLSIVRDIAASYGGELRIGRSGLGGAKIAVSIPPIPSAKPS